MFTAVERLNGSKDEKQSLNSDKTKIFRVMDIDLYIQENNSKNILENVEGLIKYITDDINTFLEEYYKFEELMVEEEFKCMYKYWPEGLYRSATSYIEKMQSVDIEHILFHYKSSVGSLNKIRQRIDHAYKNGQYLLFLAKECLATILLKEVVDILLIKYINN